tara:strand:- start:1831 stop:2997 length:1167 start_codon:yes stop_codon:yes gene_type:complete
MEHFEDSILNLGYEGGEQALEIIKSIADDLAGHSRGRVNITVKWDGAPAIFAGKHPETGKFFVSSKGLFNKTPKVNYTNADIDKNHSAAPGLAEKLKIALKYMKKLGIDSILQGDLMFTSSDLQEVEIDGTKYLTFQPNTIVYAIPVGSDLAKTIKSAKMGIVFHTVYRGNSIENLKASFNPQISAIKRSRDVWFDDATFKDVSGSATFTKQETTEVENQIKQIRRKLSTSKSFLDSFTAQKDIVAELKIFINSKVRQGALPGAAEEFITYMNDKMQSSVNNLKTEKAKSRKMSVKDKLISYLTKNKSKIDKAFVLYLDLISLKIKIVRKLETVKDIGTFVATNDGYRVTAPEGFVAIDKFKKGTTLKLVDRLEFSKQNFTAAKNWTA